MDDAVDVERNAGSSYGLPETEAHLELFEPAILILDGDTGLDPDDYIYGGLRDAGADFRVDFIGA